MHKKLYMISLIFTKKPMAWQVSRNEIRKNKAVSKKKKKEEKVKEERLEEEIIKAEKKIEEKPQEIENFEFQEFLAPEFQRTSPSLNKINAPQKEFIRLERDLANSPGFEKKESEDDSFKYTAGANPEEPKYHNYEREIASDIIRRTEIEDLGRTDERREAGFMTSSEAKLEEVKNFERYNPAKKVDTDKLGRESILERREVKYKPSR